MAAKISGLLLKAAHKPRKTMSSDNDGVLARFIRKRNGLEAARASVENAAPATPNERSKSAAPTMADTPKTTAEIRIPKSGSGNETKGISSKW